MSAKASQTLIAVPASGARPVLVRRYVPDTDAPLVTSVTALLHRAYSKQVALGLKPLAGRQDDAITLKRCSSGECFIVFDVSGAGTAVLNGLDQSRGQVDHNGDANFHPVAACSKQITAAEVGKVIGVIILNEIESDEGPDWFSRPGVASFSQLAVDTSAQGRGIGRLLLQTVEARAAERGATELALSMAEPDDDLRRFYQRHGYRIVATWKWPYTNYVSLILSKTLKPASPVLPEA